MKLIVGLGNPGADYEGTRHNIGFDIVETFAAAHNICLKNDKYAHAVIGSGLINGGKVIAALPQTYMNLSGLAIAAVRKKHDIALEDILVVCDDIDLEFGRLRIRPSGSSAGHRGLTSILEALNSRDISRLRIGIARPSGNIETSEYVLAPFDAHERAALPAVIDRATACCVSWIERGALGSMSMFNKAV